MGILQRSLSIAGRVIKVLGFMLFLFVLGLDILYHAVVLSSDQIIFSNAKMAEILSIFMAECILFFISFFILF
ncbi:hypothetical protein [Campylobacter magnus]|uniref:hypothetical protein n=1 Tax=Campylobacter magnus TaxID=3026462 RepID=UPI00235FC10B|nr:hypothetical protein [Campylobacter magnus]MDD0855415.1 hypothetical protein [Campylobacter magnus]